MKNLGNILKQDGHITSVGDDGGYMALVRPRLNDHHELPFRQGCDPHA